MEKDLILYYLKKIEKKVKLYFLNGNETLRNDLLMYLEICIEVCNMLERKFYKNVNKERMLFQDIQSSVLLRDMGSVLNFILDKKKELGYSGNVASSN